MPGRADPCARCGPTRRHPIVGGTLNAAAQLLGAAVVIVGDMNPDRLAQARSFGCETIDLTQSGECPVMRYHRQLMMAILNDKVQIAKAVNATIIPLEEAPKGYVDFDKGAAKKFVLNPHGLIAA